MVKDDEAEKPQAKTPWEAILALPVWLIALAFASLVLVVAYSLIVAKHSVSLGFLGEWGPKTEALPAGIIVAFDGPCPDKEKDAWEPYEEVKGRFVIGAGAALIGGYGNVNQFLVDLKPGNTGGTDIEGRASFNGDINKIEGSLVNLAIPTTAVVSPHGEAGNHALKYYVLPPYIALNYCRKK